MDLEGSWENQNGSLLVVEAADGESFSGRFHSRKGRAARGTYFPVAGLRNGEVISFAVSFSSPGNNLGSITTFSGRLSTDRGVDRIHTMWILARQFEDEAMTKPTQPWNTFLTNSDVFTRVGE